MCFPWLVKNFNTDGVMERYDLKSLQSELRTVLGAGLREEAVEMVKGLLAKYKSHSGDWKDKEKWSDVK